VRCLSLSLRGGRDTGFEVVFQANGGRGHGVDLMIT
jgi:hypothetical protein